jgi:hypothetical protein
MSRFSRLTLALAVGLALPLPGLAQAPWLGTDRSPRVGAELLMPRFDYQDEIRTASSALFLSGRFRAGETVTVVAELPMAFGGERYYGGARTQLGKPYVGVELGRANAPVWVEVGGHVPISVDDNGGAALVGRFADFSRQSAFLEVLSLAGALNVGSPETSRARFRLRAGPEWLIGPLGGSALLLNYGAQVAGDAGPVTASLFLNGSRIATESGILGERSVQLGTTVSCAVGGVRPGVVLRLPLDRDLRDYLDYVVGVTLEVPLH